MKHRTLFMFEITLVILMTVACSSDEAVPPESPIAVPTTSPAPVLSASITTSPIPPPGAQPTIAPNTGVATGRLMLEGKPVRGVILYLAETVNDANGQEVFVSMSRADSPKAITDDEGRFTFINVTPGNYGLILDTLLESYLLYQPGTENAVLVTISTEGEADLGTLIYDDLPLPGP